MKYARRGVTGTDDHSATMKDIEEKGQVQRHFLMSTTIELGHSLEARYEEVPESVDFRLGYLHEDKIL